MREKDKGKDVGEGRNGKNEGKGKGEEEKEEENDKICRQNSSQFKIISTLNRTTRESYYGLGTTISIKHTSRLS